LKDIGASSSLDHDAPVDASCQQRDVISFLSQPSSYGRLATPVEQVISHYSIVFLVGDRAYKLKRAIRFASVDYTTRELRERACRAELALNRLFAPRLYLDVLSINRSRAGSLTFGGPGDPVDHVVLMRRFAQADQFDRLADQGRLTHEMMRDLGCSIARFHSVAAPTPAFGGQRGIRLAIEDNHRELMRVAAVLPSASIGLLRQRSLEAVQPLAALLDLRRDQGKVRRCHGDLRLANICLFEGRASAFDCIEFSDEIGCIDVLYDLAFLLMDLHVRGQGDLAAIVLSTYEETADGPEDLRLMPLFLSVRAATRSYALAGGAMRQHDPREAARRLAQARRHLAASHRLLRAPPRWLAARW